MMIFVELKNSMNLINIGKVSNRELIIKEKAFIITYKIVSIIIFIPFITIYKLKQ